MQLRRAAEKEAKENQTTADWICNLLVKLSKKVPEKSEQIKSRKQAHAKCESNRKASETPNERSARQKKEAKAQALKRSLETKEQHQNRLDRDYKREAAKYEEH